MFLKIHRTVKHKESHGLESNDERSYVEETFDESREESNDETSYVEETFDESREEANDETSYVQETFDESREEENHEEDSVNITAPPEMEENKVFTFPCDKCDTRCASMVILGVHKTLQHKETLQFKCNECKLITNYPSNLGGHMKTHQNKRKITNIQTEQVQKKTQDK